MLGSSNQMVDLMVAQFYTSTDIIRFWNENEEKEEKFKMGVKEMCIIKLIEVYNLGKLLFIQLINKQITDMKIGSGKKRISWALATLVTDSQRPVPSSPEQSKLGKTRIWIDMKMSEQSNTDWIMQSLNVASSVKN